MFNFKFLFIFGTKQKQKSLKWKTETSTVPCKTLFSLITITDPQMNSANLN